MKGIDVYKKYMQQKTFKMITVLISFDFTTVSIP